MSIRTLLFVNILIILIVTACGEDKKTTETKTDTEKEDETVVLDETFDTPFDTLARNEVRETLEVIFEHSEANNLADLAGMMVYKGNDEERHFNAPLNINDANEKFTAESTMEVINIWINQADSREYGIYREEAEGEHTFYTQEIVFMAELNTERRKFTFLRIDDQYLLSNIK